MRLSSGDVVHTDGIAFSLSTGKLMSRSWKARPLSTTTLQEDFDGCAWCLG